MTVSKFPLPPSDEELVAYLDGALSEDEASLIAAARARDPDLAARISALEVDIDGLRDAMDALLTRAPEPRVPDAAPTAPVHIRSGAWGWQAAAAALIFVAGLGFGGIVKYGPDTPDWRQAVADYQVLYTSETVTATPLDAARRAAGLAHVATRLGLDLDEARIAVEGLTFQRAQILEFGGQALGQLVYLDGAGAPIAFCLMRAGADDSDPELTTLAGMAASSWNADGVGYIVIGPSDAATIRNAAETLRTRLSG